MELLIPFVVLFSSRRSLWVAVVLIFTATFQLAALEMEFFLVMTILLFLFFDEAYEKGLFVVSGILLLLHQIIFWGIIG